MDLLSELLENATWTNDLLWKASFYENWGYEFPCTVSGGFHIITQGSCYLRYAKRTIRLDKGDVVLIFKDYIHELVSTPRGKVVRMNKLKEKLVQSNRPENGAEPLTSLVSVRYEIPTGPQHPFFLELPEMILVRAAEIPMGDPMHTTIEMISRDIQSGIGSDLITQRLTDILLYYTLRRWLETSVPLQTGWVRAFKDEKILQTLEMIHRDMLYDWSIEALARSVGLSRASLAARFKNTLGSTVMDYIMRLRLEKGRLLAANPDLSLEEISRQVGYSSAFAFSKAYKRVYGHSPRKEKTVSRSA